MKDFVKINELRIRKNTIKKYCPNGSKSINIYYNTSRYRIDVETIVFPNTRKQKEIMTYLDTNLLL